MVDDVFSVGEKVWVMPESLSESKGVRPIIGVVCVPPVGFEDVEDYAWITHHGKTEYVYFNKDGTRHPVWYPTCSCVSASRLRHRTLDNKDDEALLGKRV